MPQVSIITPNYNGADWIERCMHSVRYQSVSDWEHIIVDDASTDNSLEVINKVRDGDERIIVLSQDSQSGPRLARNRAVSVSQGRYIAFLDGDDYWLEHKLARQISIMEEHAAPISAVAYEVRDMRGTYLRRRNLPESISYRSLLCTNLFGCSTTLYDTKYFGRVLNDCPWGDEDHYLWLHMLRDYDVKHAYGINEVLAVIVDRPGSRFSNKLRAAGRRWQTYRRAQSLSWISSCLWFGCYACTAVMFRLLSKLSWKK